MITGTFNTDEAVIRLQVRGSRGRQQEIAAGIDTGYSSWLTLPPDLVTALRLRWHSFGRGVLADGSECSFDVYEARVMWDGRLRRIRVYEFDAAPLLGIALLKGCELKVHVRSGGSVIIKRIPGWRQRRESV